MQMERHVNPVHQRNTNRVRQHALHVLQQSQVVTLAHKVNLFQHARNAMRIMHWSVEHHANYVMNFMQVV